MAELKQDPSVKTSLIAPSISWLIWSALVILSFSTMAWWGILIVQTGTWLLFGLSLLICLGYGIGGGDVLKDHTLPLRLPVWWLPVTAVVSTTLVWYMSGWWWLTTMWGFSRIILSMNYQFIEQGHDEKYTANLLKPKKVKTQAEIGKDIKKVFRKKLRNIMKK